MPLQKLIHAGETLGKVNAGTAQLLGNEAALRPITDAWLTYDVMRTAQLRANTQAGTYAYSAFVGGNG